MPKNFLKSIFFMDTAIGFNLIIFFNYFAFQTEKFHFSPKPLGSVGKNTSKYVLWIQGKIFLVKLWDIYQSYLGKVEKRGKNLSDQDQFIASWKKIQPSFSQSKHFRCCFLEPLEMFPSYT